MSSGKKNMFLLLGFVVLLFLCYKYAIKNTVVEINRKERLTSEKVLSDEIPKNLAILSQKEKYFDSILGKMNMGNTSLENNLLRIINIETQKNNVSVVDFNKPHVYVSENSHLRTFQFVLRGSFTSLIKTIYELEQNNSFGEIVSLDFEKKKNYRTRKNYLEVSVLLQNIN